MELLIADISILQGDALFLAESFLPPERIKRAKKYKYERDMLLSVAAGYLLYSTLDRLGISPNEVYTGKYGKPYIESGRVFFNISHSGDKAVLALSTSDVGVDIQNVGSVTPTMIGAACTESERKMFKDVRGKARGDMFYRLWTIKESFVKYTGRGFTVLPRRLQVDLSEPSIALDGEKQSVNFFEIAEEGYKLTVCSESEEEPNVKQVISVEG